MPTHSGPPAAALGAFWCRSPPGRGKTSYNARLAVSAAYWREVVAVDRGRGDRARGTLSAVVLVAGGRIGRWQVCALIGGSHDGVSFRSSRAPSLSSLVLRDSELLVRRKSAVCSTDPLPNNPCFKMNNTRESHNIAPTNRTQSTKSIFSCIEHDQTRCSRRSLFMVEFLQVSCLLQLLGLDLRRGRPNCATLRNWPGPWLEYSFTVVAGHVTVTPKLTHSNARCIKGSWTFRGQSRSKTQGCKEELYLITGGEQWTPLFRSSATTSPSAVEAPPR
jgi:hypothetical protein